nr:protein dopey-1 homolog [Penaeus vannamei]
MESKMNRSTVQEAKLVQWVNKYVLTSCMSGLSLEEYDLLGDSKYRAYVAAVDKTLRNFENTSEWADLISTLGKLNKVLLSHMKYPVVPRRITISKRLAQCMHPALPSGVHLKALETYDIIFKCMGTNRLSQELFIYSAGLFPLFSSAAMNVRSALLTVYETHFVPLGPRLRPGLNGFLSGILAGLEEGSDHLERTSQLLTRVAEGVGQAEFFGCLWDCVWGNSGVRLPAITHITSCYNKKLSTEDQLYILGTNIDVMVSALCQAMEDSSVLVQRAALDLTLAALPMHNTQLLRPDLVRIVTSAILVLLRRDMSLNRRLYAWLLGSEINLSLLSSEHPVVKRLNSAVSDSNTEDGTEVNAYFETFSRPLLVEGVVSCLQASQGTNPPDLRPYRLIVSLLDKPEIGPFILDDIFLDLLRCLYHTCQVLQASNNTPSEPSSRRQSTTDKQTPPPPSRSPDGSKPVIEGNRGLHEVTKTATLLFSALQPSYPWMHLTGLLSMACQAKASQMDGGEKKDDGKLVLDVGSSVMTVCEICTLLQHLLTSLPHDTQQQTQASRLPEVLSTVTSLLTEHLSTLTAKELSAGLSLSQAILHKLIPSVTLPPSASQSRPDSRASITTFASLQMHALSQVSTIPRPLLVQEAFARESPPSECGIVQIGIEASEDDPNSIERKKTEDLSVDSLTDESNNNENLVDGEAETSFISVVSNSSMEDSERLKGEAEGENKEKQDSSVEKENEMTTTNAIKPEISEDLFEIDQDGEIVNSSEDKHANLEEVPSDSGVDMEEIPSQPTELARFLISQEASEDEYESAPQSPSHQGSMPLYNYVKVFEKFFLQFIQKKIILENSNLADFQSALSRSGNLQMDSLSELNYLLRECLQCCENKVESTQSSPVKSKGKKVQSSPWSSPSRVSTSSSGFSQSQREITDFTSVLQLHHKADEQFEVFKAACSILVDLSSLPTTPGLPLNRPSNQIPHWFVGLIACVINGSQVSPRFVMASVSTLLELVMLAQSELSVWRSEHELGCKGGPGVVSVNIIPLLLPTHTHILLHHTTVYQHMARQLWSHLRPSMSHLHVGSTELLLQLHNLTLPRSPSVTLTSAPPQSPMSVVEREILATLTYTLQVPVTDEKESGVLWSHEGIRAEYDSVAMHQWMTLWQVSRNLSSGLAGNFPGFDRYSTMLYRNLCNKVMLNIQTIHSKTFPISRNAESQRWCEVQSIEIVKEFRWCVVMMGLMVVEVVQRWCQTDFKDLTIVILSGTCIDHMHNFFAFLYLLPFSYTLYVSDIVYWNKYDRADIQSTDDKYCELRDTKPELSWEISTLVKTTFHQPCSWKDNHNVRPLETSNHTSLVLTNCGIGRAVIKAFRKSGKVQMLCPKPMSSLTVYNNKKPKQEVSGKLLECCSSIAGSCLEATTWLRRNLTVKTDTTEKKDGMNDASAYSVAALSVLAELLAPLLDVLYVSEEKDKVVPLLTNIMANVVPYLRNHTRSNMPAFAACSQLLSSLSGYQYTLRAWRRDVIDLLLDPQAFMMLPPILTYWRTIVDFLCTHDKTVFKELLTRVSMSQGGSLSLFSSKESEYEIRAGLLKRLAFTIFCSETDQYMRHIPDIQERLAEVTRLGQVVPSLVAQVLLCFRVLLLRMSPRGVTSLWPVIITELVQVFLMMEQELATDTEQFSKKGGSSHLKRLSTLDSSWVFSSQNGLNAHNHPAWLTLYLAACKLLDLMLALPAQHLPQFQMYRWAFVGPVPTTDVEEKTEGAGNILLKSCDFVPHIARIAKLMADKPGSGKNKMLEHRPGELLLKMSSISTLLDLQPFFNTLTSPSFTPAAATIGQSPPGILSSFPSSTSLPSSGPSSVSGTSATPNSSLAHIEAVIERDFLEPLPS